MSKTALLRADAEFEEEIPDGGIAGFVMSDAEFEELARQEAANSFGTSGIAEFQEVSRRMAQYGRGGDRFVAHMAPGELVVPAPLIERSPELRESIFSHLREMGIEDPEQYVVGSTANSINPETGLMEFGFFSSAFKAVKSVVKKAAPIVLPMVLAATPLGPVFGAALGSGIASFISGGDMGDALKAAAISGGIGAVTAGFTGQGTFGQNVKGAFSDPVGRAGATATAAGKTFNDGTFFQQGDLFGTGAARYDEMFGGESTDAVSPAADPYGDTLVQNQMTAATAPVTDPYYGGITMGPEFVGPGYDASLYMSGTSTRPEMAVPASWADSFLDTSPLPAEALDGITTGAGESGLSTFGGAPSGGGIVDKITGYADQASDLVFGGSGMSVDDAMKIVSENPLYAKVSPDKQLALAQKIASDSGPSMLRQYGPALALAGGAAYLGGAFDTPPEEELNLVSGQPTGADLYASDPGKYALSAPATTVNYPNVTTNDGYSVASRFNTPEDRARLAALVQQQQRQNPFVRTLAHGGEVYPRRNGGIMPNEGVPGQDSVRAMLMPGEFVMTTDAVNGAGGINNMYDMMRGLERRERAMS
jgi:hypothetical protein